MIDSPVLAIVVFAAICAAPLLLRRVRSQAPGGIRVTGRSAISKQSVVAVVVVDGRRLLVGAGDRGVELLAELEPADEDAVGATGTAAPGAPAPSIDLSSADAARVGPIADGRTDATDGAAIDPARLRAALGARGGPTSAGPGTGLLDRLRAMTVRTTPVGRPSHVIHRR